MVTSVFAEENNTAEVEAWLEREFRGLPDDQPIYMLNMLRFRDKAEYLKGTEFSEKGWTGAEAYAEYGKLVQPMASALGATTSAGWTPQRVLDGPDGERWDAIFVARYPSQKEFIKMISSEAYQKVSFHRTAALADGRGIRMAALPEVERLLK